MFGLFQSHCQICGNSFNRTRYRWQIRGSTAWVCPRCNSTLEKRVSAAAFGRPVDFPEVRPPSGCGGLVGLFLVAIVLAGVASLVVNRSSSKPSRPAPTQSSGSLAPAVPLTPEAPLSSVPLFRSPQQAAKASLDLGLVDTDHTKPAWREGELGWYSLAKLVTHKGGLKKVGDVDDDITCMHASKTKEQVEYVRWTANIYNRADTTTAPRFKELCLAYVRKLGCEVPVALFDKVDPINGQHFDTTAATFELKKVSYDLGYCWQLTITAK
jgi:hypothetical protein